MAPLLLQLAREPVAHPPRTGSQTMEQEVNIAKQHGGAARIDTLVGTPSVYSCPECGGVLHEIQDHEFVRYRCRVGHAFTTESVLQEQSEALETALWTALNTLEESISLNQRMARQAEARGQAWLAGRFETKQHEAEQRAELIRQVLITQDPIALGEWGETNEAMPSPGTD